MKLQIVSLVFAAGVLASCGTTYTRTSSNAAYNVNVPSPVTANFSAQYPDAKNIVWNRYDASAMPIDWEFTGWPALDSSDYSVSFEMGSTRYHAWYDANGTLVGTTYSVSDHATLPSAVHTALQEKYQGYSIDAVDRLMWGNESAYEIKLKKEDSKLKLLIDSNGNVVKEKQKD